MSYYSQEGNKYLAMLEAFAKELGHVPTFQEVQNNIDLPPANNFAFYFGSYSNAAEIVRQRLPRLENEEEEDDDEEEEEESTPVNDCESGQDESLIKDYEDKHGTDDDDDDDDDTPRVRVINYTDQPLVIESSRQSFEVENPPEYACTDTITESETFYLANYSPDTPQLEIVRKRDVLGLYSREKGRLAFPDPQPGVFYIVFSKKQIELARSTGRSVDDLIYPVSKYTLDDGIEHVLLFERL